MNPKDNNNKANDPNLRETAEKQLAGAPVSEEAERPAEELLHELRVRQNELEMQNEALRLAQLDMEASRNRYIDLYEFAPVGYFTLGMDGMITEINLTAVTLLGRERNKLLGKAFHSFMKTEDQDRWVRYLMLVKEHKEKGAVEMAMQRGDGTAFYAHLDCMMIHSMVRVTLTDITERKRAEEERAAYEQRFRDMVNTTDGIVWEADARTFQFTFISEKAVKLLGFPASDWLAPGFWVSRLHPEDATWAPEFCASCTGRLEPHDFEYRFIARDGRTVWLRDIVTVVAEDGCPRWLRGIMVDITAQKQVADALQASRDRLDSVLQTALDGYWLVDLEGHIIDANEAAAKMLGYTREALLQLGPKDIDTIDTPADVKARIERIIKIGGERFETKHRKQSGEIIDVEVSVALLPDGSALVVFVRDITERRQAEEALKGSKALLSETEQIGKVGGWSFDIDTMLTTWTDEVYRIHEVDLSNRSTVEEGVNFYTQESRPIIAKAVQRAIECGEGFDLELELITAKGNTRAVHTIGRADLNNRRVYGFFQDITERKQALEALQNERLRLRTILDTVGDPIFVKDNSHRITLTNQAFDTIFGLPKDAAIGKTLVENVPANEREHFLAVDRQVIDTGNTDEREESLTVSGVTRTIVTRKTRYIAESGERFLVGSIHDITERKQAENVLRTTLAELERFREALDGVGAYVYIKDIQSRYHYANRLTLELFGCSAEELIGKGDADFFPPESAQQLREVDLKVFSGGRSEQEFNVGGGGLAVSHRMYWDIKTPLYADSEHKTVFGLLGIATDITERKQTEHELETYRHNLEALVKERTLELQLAKEVAEAANRAKTTFLANMSHELRTPMNGVMGMIYLASLRMTDPKGLDLLNTANTSADKLLVILNDILDLTKIESERIALESVPLEISAVVEELTALLRHKAVEKDLLLTIDIPVALLRQPLKGDPLRLGQILLNLVGNAIKFTQHGEVVLRARVVDESIGAVNIRFEVTDTGIGIDSEAQKRLFNLFEQGDNSTTRKYGGTGLGLAISKRLVLLMGGEIGVESEPDKGSTFWLTLPLKKGDLQSSSASPGELIDTEIELIAKYAGRRILLAEDDPINCKVAMLLLAHVGLVVDVAEDGEQALDLARNNDYALILMDVRMPKMDGLEATRQIRRLSEKKRTPILAITANAHAEDKARCLDAGMDDFLAKPVRPEQILVTLLNWLNKSQVG